MTQCATCGFENPAGFGFCGKCGGPLREAATRSERRQLTVLFCDVVDSVRLADRLDPEDLRDVLRAYHDVAGTVLERYGGHTAQVLGDGLLVYFGYPTAHEDDPRRAILSALAILDEVRVLDDRLRRKHGLPFAVRFGVHTGTVVAGGVSVGTSREDLAVGQTPNVAARLQSLAEPDTVLISGETQRLVQGFFDSRPIGPRALKGIAQPVDVYRVTGQSDVVNPFERVTHDSLTSLVGRDVEMAVLDARFTEAAQGNGCAVAVVAEAGLGKSRLLHQFRQSVSARPHHWLACYGSPFHQGTALFPLVRLAGAMLGVTADMTVDDKYRMLEATATRFGLPHDEAVPLLAKLLSIAPTSRFPESTLGPQRQKERTLEYLVEMIRALAIERPLVFIIEDLHVVDPTTTELVHRLLELIASWPVLVMLTTRPGGESSLAGHAAVTMLTLQRLSESDIRTLIQRVAREHPLSDEVCRRLVEKADGVPLFGEELTKAVLDTADPRSLTSTEVPTSLTASLTARLDRLGSARAVAELASVVGREFSYPLLRAVYAGGELQLEHGLRELERAEIVFTRGRPPHADYVFKHALVQDAAYNLLLKSARRVHHAAIAEALTTQFQSVAETQPELVGHHYAEADQPAAAIPYWVRAGDRAWERSANQEGAQSLRRAMALVDELPKSERARYELDVQLSLGRVLALLKGYGDQEVGSVFRRAFELCEQLGDAEQAFAAADGLHAFYLVTGQMAHAIDFGGRLLQRAEASGDPAFLSEAHYKVGANHWFAGQFSVAFQHLQRAVELGTPDIARRLAVADNAAVQARSIAGGVQWVLGQPDAAKHSALDAVTMARDLGHPQTLVGALTLGIWTLLPSGEYPEMMAFFGEALPMCETHGFAWWQAVGGIFASYTQCQMAVASGDAATMAAAAPAVAMMQGILAALDAGGARVGRPQQLGYLAEALIRLGRAEEARAPLAEALAFADQGGQHFHDAELHRLTGEAIWHSDVAAAASIDEADAHLVRALAIAREQAALSFELRAAISRTQLLRHSPRGVEARAELAAIYGRFTEGFNTRDLRTARALLHEVANDSVERPAR